MTAQQLKLAFSNAGYVEVTTLEQLAREPNRMLRSGKPILTQLIENDAVDAEGVRYLLFKGADPFMKDHCGSLAMHAAALFNRRAILDVLLEHCGNEVVNLPNRQNVTLLQIATFNGYHDMAKMLIEAGAFLNDVNNHDMTALSGAVTKIDLDMVRLLLDAGADVTKYEQEGGFPLVERLVKSACPDAKRADQNEIAILLAAAGAKPLPALQLPKPAPRAQPA